MNQIHMTLIALLCSLIVMATALAHGTEKSHKRTDTQDGIDVALQWLKLVDEKNYQTSWETAAPEFQDAVSQEEWDKTVSKLRTAMGPLKERRLFHDRFTPVLPGVPDGEYIVLRFVTTFENKQNAMETVSLKRGEQEDRTWKVAGYFIQ